MTLRDKLLDSAQTVSIATFLVGCIVFFGIMADAFLSAGNILNLLRQAAPMLLVATAMTFVITTGGIDLSVGSQVALTNAVCAILLHGGAPWPPVVAGLIALGGLVGAVQGWFAAYQGVPSFIVTLAGLTGLRGFALLLTKGYSIPIDAGPAFDALGRGSVMGVPVPAAIAVVIAVLGYVGTRLDAVRPAGDGGRREPGSGAARGHAGAARGGIGVRARPVRRRRWPG